MISNEPVALAMTPLLHVVERWPYSSICRRKGHNLSMAQMDSVIDRDSPDSEARPSMLRHLAWPLGTLGLLLPAASATLVFLDRSAIHTFGAADPNGVVLPIGFTIIGALLVSRRPRNTIGWVFLGIGVFTGIEGAASQYVFRSSHFHRLPFVVWAAWLESWVIWLVYPAGLALF